MAYAVLMGNLSLAGRASTANEDISLLWLHSVQSLETREMKKRLCDLSIDIPSSSEALLYVKLSHLQIYFISGLVSCSQINIIIVIKYYII